MNTPALLVITGTLVMAACGSDDDAIPGTATTTPPATTIPASTTTVARTSTTTSTSLTAAPPDDSTDAETSTTIITTTTLLTTTTTTVAPASTSVPITTPPPASAPATSTTIVDSNCAIAVEVVAGTSGTTRQVDIRVESQRRDDYVNVELVWAGLRTRLALYISPAGIGTTRVDAPGTDEIVARVYDTSAFQPSGVRCRT